VLVDCVDSVVMLSVVTGFLCVGRPNEFAADECSRKQSDYVKLKDENVQLKEENAQLRKENVNLVAAVKALDSK